jgi:hypothetical protein
VGWGVLFGFGAGWGAAWGARSGSGAIGFAATAAVSVVANAPWSLTCVVSVCASVCNEVSAEPTAFRSPLLQATALTRASAVKIRFDILPPNSIASIGSTFHFDHYFAAGGGLGLGRDG